jgi:hypothetical protein
MRKHETYDDHCSPLNTLGGYRRLMTSPHTALGSSAWASRLRFCITLALGAKIVRLCIKFLMTANKVSITSCFGYIV